MNRRVEQMAEWIKFVAVAIVYLLLTLAMSAYARVDNAPAKGRLGLKLDSVPYDLNGQRESLRVGVYPEQKNLKACIIYLEGLGDSIRNHEPLFASLSGNGYRVIAFDYLGQGGSSGDNEPNSFKGRKKPELRDDDSGAVYLVALFKA